MSNQSPWHCKWLSHTKPERVKIRCNSCRRRACLVTCFTCTEKGSPHGSKPPTFPGLTPVGAGLDFNVTGPPLTGFHSRMWITRRQGLGPRRLRRFGPFMETVATAGRPGVVPIGAKKCVGKVLSIQGQELLTTKAARQFQSALQYGNQEKSGGAGGSGRREEWQPHHRLSS